MPPRSGACFIVFVALAACTQVAAEGPVVTKRAASAVASAPAPDPSPEVVTRDWLAAIEARDWRGCADLHAPRAQGDAAQAREIPDAMKARLVVTAKKIRAALERGSPVFVEVRAILAEPTHLEWYYCGEPPQGEVWKSPCAVSVVKVGDRYAIYDVTDDE